MISLFITIKFLVLSEIISAEIMFCVIFLVFVSQYLISLFWHHSWKWRKPCMWLEYILHQTKFAIIVNRFVSHELTYIKELKAHYTTVSQNRNNSLRFYLHCELLHVHLSVHVCVLMCMVWLLATKHYFNHFYLTHKIINALSKGRL